MKVAGPPQPEGCLTCHVHASQEHLEDAKCANCHVPLAASGFTPERIAALTKPTDHEGEAFLAQIHGAAVTPGTARCATCPVRDLCTACHVDPTPTAIRNIPPAPPSMELPPFEARYTLPTAHEDPQWLQYHGKRASPRAAPVTRAATVPSAIRMLPRRPHWHCRYRTRCRHSVPKRVGAPPSPTSALSLRRTTAPRQPRRPKHAPAVISRQLPRGSARSGLP